MEREAKNAQIGIDHIRAVMHHFRGEHGWRKSIPPSQKLWTALQALDGYLTGQSDWLVNYAERHRAGLRVGNATTEGIGNFLVTRRMNKSQQLRWWRRGADFPLQVRGAVYNGTFDYGFVQHFHPANDTLPQVDCRLTPKLATVPETDVLKYAKDRSSILPGKMPMSAVWLTTSAPRLRYLVIGEYCIIASVSEVRQRSGMKRRELLSGAGAIPLLPLARQRRPAAAAQVRRVRPSDLGWPSQATWDKLNEDVLGRLGHAVAPTRDRRRATVGQRNHARSAAQSCAGQPGDPYSPDRDDGPEDIFARRRRSRIRRDR
jgi:hypothetical protein